MTGDPRTQIQRIKELIRAGTHREALSLLRSTAGRWDDFPLQHRYAALLRSIPKAALELKTVRVAIATTSTLDHFVEALRLWLALDGFDAEIYVSEFNTMDQAVLDPGSPLYAFKPDIVWLFSNHRDLDLAVPNGCPTSMVDERIRAAVDRFAALWDAVSANCPAHTIQNNADLPVERPFGNFDGCAVWGRCNLFRRFNLALSDRRPSGVTIFDLDFVSSLFGKRAWLDERYWYHSKHAFSLDAIGLMAFHSSRLIRGLRGEAKKCLVLDLDNTLWGGVIGDDGLEGIKLGHTAEGEAYVDFQKYLLKLKDRGIILAVCSKNEEETAKAPFLQHPDMPLRLEDIAVFMANWNNKADNIREIASILNIGLDSMVFVDDNPVECALVASMLPMVSVPEIGQDPSLYIEKVDSELFFETAAFSEEDQNRGTMYRGEAERKSHQTKFKDLAAFLKDLDMRSAVAEFDDFHLPRIAQLINKSNQFNLTTLRYSEAQIRAMTQDKAIVSRYFTLEDRFGDNGLISALILRQDGRSLVVDTWVMSCRVLSRGMEDFIHNEMLGIARTLGSERILGKYIPTKKNKLVADLYKRLDYSLMRDEAGTTYWEYRLSQDTLPHPTYIERIPQDGREEE